jgi:hypothetical protein
MPTLEIFDQQNGVLSFDLRDILNVIAAYVERLNWYVVEFEPAVLTGGRDKSAPPPPLWVTELWRKSETGAVQPLKWERLKELSIHVLQTMNALFVATEPGTAAPDSSVDPNDAGCALVIQAVDTSFWAVTSKDNAVLNALKAHFHDVRMESGTKRYF